MAQSAPAWPSRKSSHHVITNTKPSRTPWVVPIVPCGRTPWVVGQLWRAPTAYRRRVAWVRLCPCVADINWLWAENSTVEIFDVVKTVLAVAVWTAEYSRQLVFGPWINVNLYYERPTAQGTTQAVRTQGDVIPPTTSYNGTKHSQCLPFLPRTAHWLTSLRSTSWQRRHSWPLSETRSPAVARKADRAVWQHAIFFFFWGGRGSGTQFWENRHLSVWGRQWYCWIGWW